MTSTINTQYAQRAIIQGRSKARLTPSGQRAVSEYIRNNPQPYKILLIDGKHRRFLAMAERYLTSEEILSASFVGVIQAHIRFDPERWQLRSYVLWEVHRAIYQDLRRKLRTARNQSLTSPEDESQIDVPDTRADECQNVLLRTDGRKGIGLIAGKYLSGDELRVISLMYLTPRGMTIEDCRNITGFSTQRIAALRNQAIDKMRQHLQSRGVCRRDG